ncbi:MAG TPA: DUF2071 domain-containing protein [Planctomycetaceae bacterium]|nr:DUF2071 domain-containing protein [Planctomycetaceae bacterium]
MVVAHPATIDRISPAARPNQRVAGYQTWRNLLFLHWRISPAEVRASVPDWLSVDTFDGSAWIGLVLFSMHGVRPWWAPPIPGISAFPETNVRTYVHSDGEPGVLFLSLDAGGSVGARVGRSRWGLPYHHSKMRVRRSGTHVRYECERLWPGNMGVGGIVEAEIGDEFTGLHRDVEPGRAVPGSLEHFLVERYVLYTQKGEDLLRGQVHHRPYPLREAKVTYAAQSFLSDLGLHCERPPDHAVFSEGVSVEVFALRAVVGEL